MRTFTKLLAPLVAVLLAAPMTSCSSNEGSVNTALEGEGSDDCTLTQGYWKNHEEAWPVSSLTLGSVTYSKDELLSIFHTPVRGNGLIALAHQLIAAKLNIAAGAPDVSISASIAAADAMIGSLVVPPVGDGSLSTEDTGDLIGALDDYNNGATGPGHCGDAPPPPSCGNGMLETGEHCDDGNTVSGDGCSATCECEDEPTGPVCGDGVKDMGEECDDGNTVDGDGCSSTCVCEEPPVPVCGNGTVEAGETCDDGNTTSGDGCSSTCLIEEQVCGNGVKEGSEGCDDGNTTSGDGCSSTCQCEPSAPTVVERSATSTMIYVP